ncbi:arginine deiminase family protein [Mycoplasmopsis caviae]|uniref:Arginine deiminase domain-containing protein n=1 Tax=Mycoplasmopsis caviae TaxID=55603 RepID=A0A3P8K8E2_9BACT|nr:arginine deiminase family protein [Mycoplasmopsis caviae]UUD35655.1 arginine deiminase family protein [Mycoplasmopsis caviae]VDR41599.1 arginine deiminase domain-containing protein [Mycoplasmopsis caviae]
MSKINVYSEIGKLKEVLVHTPGDEIRRVAPSRLDELLFSAILEADSAIEEHKRFLKILKENKIKAIQLDDLVVETYKLATQEQKDAFINEWLDKAEPVLEGSLREKVKEYILGIGQKNLKKMIRTMMAGILKTEMNIELDRDLVVDPMPNLYFTRDPFASAGNGITLNNMKYVTRKRETTFCNFVFTVHPDYKDTPKWFDRTNLGNIEGGDVFIYNRDTLVLGVSERTNKDAVMTVAKNIQHNSENKFKKIVAINVPPMPNLMHLDTWLTMVDRDVFLYSPNMMSVLKIWEIDLSKDEIEMVESNKSLSDMLESIIGKKPKLVPIAGVGASQLDIDIETHFDGTNYLTIAPGVVVGYSRNRETEKALKKAGVKVLSFDGNQLSLGMGSARCMSMPLVREDIE